MPPYRVPRRHGQVPGTQAYIPTNVNSRVSNTVSVTGSVTSTITGSVAVSSVAGSVAVTTTTSTAFTAAQVAVTTASTLLFATGSFGVFREVVNTATASAMFLGPVAVTITTGHRLAAGGVFSMPKNSAPLYAIIQTGSETATTIGWA